MRSHSGNVSRNQQAPLVKQDGKKTRAHSANLSRNQLSFRQEGKVEEVSLYQCFQKPTSIHITVSQSEGKIEEVSLSQCFQKPMISQRGWERLRGVTLPVFPEINRHHCYHMFSELSSCQRTLSERTVATEITYSMYNVHSIVH